MSDFLFFFGLILVTGGLFLPALIVCLYALRTAQGPYDRRQGERTPT